MSDLAEIKNALRHWVARKGRNVALEDIDAHTPILERRIITSLQIMDLILYLEHLRGAPIDVERIQPGAFATIDSICRTFFAEEPSHV